VMGLLRLRSGQSTAGYKQAACQYIAVVRSRMCTIDSKKVTKNSSVKLSVALCRCYKCWHEKHHYTILLKDVSLLLIFSVRPNFSGVRPIPS